MIRFEKYGFTPVLGWSNSRYETFSTCRRKYFYQYYGKYDRDIPQSRIDQLKALTSVPLVVGSIVHNTIAAILSRMLKSNADIDRVKFNEFISRQIQLACDHSIFFEVYYAEQEAVRPEDVEGMVGQCIESFMASERYEWVKQNAYGNEQYLIEPPGYGETRLQGMKIYAKVDFLFVVDGRAVILDWKTGKQDKAKHKKQLLGYSAWAVNNLNLSPATIEGVVAYLKPFYEEIVIHPTETDLQDLTAISFP